MRIKSFEFKDLETGWELEKLEFQRLNLLVGASGVGKSMILRNLMRVVDLATNTVRLNRSKLLAEWGIYIEDNNDIFGWHGHTKSKISESDYDEDDYELLGLGNVVFETESIRKGVQILVEREESKMQYLNQKMPKLNQKRSVLDLLSEEPVVQFKDTLKKVKKFDMSEFYRDNSLFFNKSNVVKLMKSHDPELSLFSDEVISPVYLLYRLKERNDRRFQKISSHFLNIFPSIESLSIGRKKNELPFLFIKEKKVEASIRIENISQGMLATLMHLIVLELAPENSVILVDEFENSLGVNCLDAVVDLINNNERNIQFILTSHHPYIINNIPIDKWKIVLREGTKVRAVDAAELGFKESRHDAYAQLINHDAFQTGRWPKQP